MIKEQKRLVEEQKRLELDHVERVQTELTLTFKVFPVFFEPIVSLPTSVEVYLEKGVAMRAFLQREAKNIPRPQQFLHDTPFSHGSFAFDPPVDPEGTLNIVIRSTVSTSMLTRLVRLSSEHLAPVASVGISSQQYSRLPSLKILQLSERGQIVGSEKQIDCLWSIDDKPYLILNHADRGVIDRRLGSMRCIYQGILVAGIDMSEPSPREIGLQISLYGATLSGYHAFLNSLPDLRERDPGIVPELILECGQVTTDDISNSFFTIAYVDAKAGKPIPPLWKGTPFFGLFSIRFSADVGSLLVWATEDSIKKESPAFSLILQVYNGQDGLSKLPTHVEGFRRSDVRLV
ncbi:hypothetical protein QFC21_005356 [Naganishia friedmannii]|uniref:Uncharacterized protein n=1 Tax=Naganishia friedmannii TaxID=89922 RepID=A0ACC2V9F0_9TREE|nr:hypothetical protein QFC21_005356 [Naganishia friedmannii]